MEETNEDQGVQQQTTADTGEQGAERTDWKGKFTALEASTNEIIGSLKRDIKDLKKSNAPKADTSPESQPQDKKGFDYGQLAYLEAKGFSDKADQQWLESMVQESGFELKDLLDKPWVQNELKERKEHRMAEAATPSGSKAAGQSGRDTVDYWVAKINQGSATVKDIPDRELRFKVVEARHKAEKQKGEFYDA